MSESAPTQSSFKEFSEQATVVSEANTTTAQELNQQMAANLAIEARTNSAEVAALNDAAEIAIYGTHGRTAGYVDVNGKPLTAPIKGRIDRILESPRWGTSDAERQANAPKAQAEADKYKKSVDELQGQGFELCQAKLILDEREKLAYTLDQADRKHWSKVNKNIRLITDQYIKNGDSPAEAKAKAEQRVARRKLEAEGSDINPQTEESKLKNLIRTKGIFTAEELKRAQSPTGPKAPKSPEDRKRDRDNERARQHLTNEVRAAREEYARLSAERGRRGLHFKKDFRKEAVEEARQKYEDLRDQLLVQEVRMSNDAGVTAERLDQIVEICSITDAEHMTEAAYRQRLVATGTHRIDRHGNLVPVRPKNILGRAANAFYTWWGEQEDAKFFSTATAKKALVMGAAGAAVGVPAALAGSILLGPIAGGAAGAYAANRIAKGVMAYHISRRSGRTRANSLHARLIGAINNGHADNIGDVIDSQTSNEVRRNRRRTAISIGSAAIGGTLGEVGISHLLSGGGASEHAHAATVHSPGTEHPITASTHPPAPHEHHLHHAGRHPAEYGASLDHSGDTISDEVAKSLHEHGYALTQDNIDKLTSATLHANGGLTYDQARHLPIGFKFNIPQEAMEKLAKAR